MLKFLKKQSPVRIIASAFLIVILLGSVLLMMPFCLRENVTLNYIDSLFTSTSAVCVTGLMVVDIGTTFTPIGQVIIAILIQIGGLGVSTIGAGIILAVGKKINLKGVKIIKETSNLNSSKGIISFVRNIFVTTIIIELIGAILSFCVFVQDLPVGTAIGVSLFHSIASFNNAGFDILGGLVKNDGSTFAPLSNLLAYENNLLLNFTTSGLIILGGIGFLVIKELIRTRFRWKKFSMHTKVVLVMTTTLIVLGTILLKFTEDISWLNAFFFSVSSRTAGFSTRSLGSFSLAGLLVLVLFMYIGASPGSTGGGIKTTTFFVLLQGIKSSATNKSEKAFKYSMPKDAFKKAAVIAIIASFVIFVGTYLLVIFEANTTLPVGIKSSGQTITFMDALFEITSAFGTVGLSTGITGFLTLSSKTMISVIMFIGRLGPLSVASLWSFARNDSYSYPKGNISIG